MMSVVAIKTIPLFSNNEIEFKQKWLKLKVMFGLNCTLRRLRPHFVVNYSSYGFVKTAERLTLICPRTNGAIQVI